jgi:hypothetical protein
MGDLKMRGESVSQSAQQSMRIVTIIERDRDERDDD